MVLYSLGSLSQPSGAGGARDEVGEEQVPLTMSNRNGIKEKDNKVKQSVCMKRR